MSNDSVDRSGGALEWIDECAGMKHGLLEEEVELSAVGFIIGKIVGEEFCFEATGDVVLEFNLGVELVGGSPGLGEGQT